MERFSILFLSHSAPGAQLWFYLHLCIWVVHWSLLLRLPWRTWVCPSEDWVWRWCGYLDQRPWKHQVWGGAGAGDTALLGFFLASGNSAPVRTRYGGGSAGCIVGNLEVPGVQGSRWPWAHEISTPLRVCVFLFFFFPSLWQLYPSEDWVWRWPSCLDLKEPGCTRCIGKPAATGAGYEVLLEPFSSLWQLVFKGLPWLVLLWCLVQQALKGPHLWGLPLSAASIICGERERLQ